MNFSQHIVAKITTIWKNLPEMDKFQAIRAFVTVAEEGGFAAAARVLGGTRSGLSRLISGLEQELGAQLLNRTTRKVALTESGVTYLEQARSVLADLDEADRMVAEMRAEPAGTLRINAPMTFGTMYLADAVAVFMKAHPQLKVQLVLNDRFVDPMEEGFDLTVRIADLPDSTLIARRIAPINLMMVASPDYFAENPPPRVPADLDQHKVLHYGRMEGAVIWKLRGSGGEEPVRVDEILCSNNGEVLKAAALRGLGVARLPEFVVSREVSDEQLVPVLEGFEPQPAALFCVYPPNRFLPAKVRRFIDFMADTFSANQPWNR
ncbi:MAG: LysR substrate-binding domain-containing protein [Hyphomicrobiales bacterium]